MTLQLFSFCIPQCSVIIRDILTTSSLDGWTVIPVVHCHDSLLRDGLGLDLRDLVVVVVFVLLGDLENRPCPPLKKATWKKKEPLGGLFSDSRGCCRLALSNFESALLLLDIYFRFWYFGKSFADGMFLVTLGTAVSLFQTRDSCSYFSYVTTSVLLSGLDSAWIWSWKEGLLVVQ